MRIRWLRHTTLAAGLLAVRVAALEPLEAPGPDALPEPAAVGPGDLLARGGSDPAGGVAASEIEAARQRLNRANASYSNMMARNYPRGDARAAIVAERRAAEAHLLAMLRASGSTDAAVPPPAMRW